MTTLWQDVRYGLRMLAKNRGFTVIALVTLAVGIGANTIMFSLVNAMLFRPVHVKAPDQLVRCGIRNFGPFRYTAYVDMRDSNPAFSDLIAHNVGSARGTLVHGGAARSMDLMYVSANYFSALGVAPTLGRTFSPEEERYGAEPVVVLSYRIWQRLGGNREIVGQPVLINATPCRVIGAAPERFTGTAVVGPDLWLPLGTYGLVDRFDREKPAEESSETWNYPPLTLVGRLKPGLGMSEAQASLQSLAPRLRENDPRQWNTDSMFYLSRLARLSTGIHDNDQGVLRRTSVVLMGISGAVLLIACLNLASMMVVQGAARQREIAIRMALGSGRLRIVRQLFIESLLLALLGGVLALIPAFWGVRVLNAWMAAGDSPVRLTSSLDIRVLTATLGFCLIATVLFGLKPALRLSGRDVVGDLKDSAGGVFRATRRRWRLIPRGLSVICQITLSVVLVMGAVLFARTALKTARIDPGFGLEGKLVVKIAPLAAGYTRTQAGQACNRLTERLKSMPGIRAAGLSTSFPVGLTRSRFADRAFEYVPGAEDDASGNLLPRAMDVYEVNGDYFEAMGISLLRGRPFRQLDHAPDAEKVVVIDERLARKLRPDGDAVGCLIQYGWGPFLDLSRVVGIVSSLRGLSGDAEDRFHVYSPISSGRPPIYIHLRIQSGAPEAALMPSLGADIRKLDPRLPVVSVMSLAEQHRTDPAVSSTWFLARIATMFGAMALFLAGLGLYAVKSHMVASRTPEIGIRMALGATRLDILTLVLRQGAISTVVGLLVGTLLAIAMTRVIRRAVQGISTIDLVSIVITVAILTATSLLATYIPARRAARIDPMVALRHE